MIIFGIDGISQNWEDSNTRTADFDSTL